jgi:hypothetical protein
MKSILDDPMTGQVRFVTVVVGGEYLPGIAVSVKNGIGSTDYYAKKEGQSCTFFAWRYRN